MAKFTIQLEELCIEMYLGIHDFERDTMQRVLVTVEIGVEIGDFRDGGFFDYDRIADFLRGFSGRHIDTQEELIVTTHGFILALEGVISATVCSKKPDVYPDAQSVGVCYSGG
ncbi:dihydroneopterin aldolase [Puniceibacterium sp. IMCC21224]|uniref:dihydroneopterin aldolase n=1 Tax=Puniceibacterium sp. IMCC21224 TaxID=1618204 RepID=UPI00065D73FD|nr:dihydroneopterin aldolase [Puniceibacterium sp. IMCC21224]KMK65622.1 dihydroneopterin aldolase [Puniceibacterium sp. IMCC21224]